LAVKVGAEKLGPAPLKSEAEWRLLKPAEIR